MILDKIESTLITLYDRLSACKELKTAIVVITQETCLFGDEGESTPTNLPMLSEDNQPTSHKE